jgi:hypothetical protein
MDQFVRGVIVLGCLVIGLFFLRFFRRSGDRLFLYFAVSFVLLAAERFLLALLHEFGPPSRAQLDVSYWVRAFAYLVIVVGIVDKNLTRRTEPKTIQETQDLAKKSQL